MINKNKYTMVLQKMWQPTATPILLLCTALLLVFTSTKVVSEEQTTTIEADKALINSETNSITYTGNVIIRHPVVTIWGESVQLIDNHEQRFFSAQGNPATVEWKHTEDTSRGSAQSIMYLERSDIKTLDLVGNTHINHQGNKVEAHAVNYDFMTKVLNVSSSSSKKSDQSSTTSTAEKPNRVKFILKQKQ